MATKILIFNGALSELGDTRLATTTDAVEARYVLDTHYDTAIAYCLTMGPWDFALRKASIATSTTPAFDYTYGFAKPADYLKLVLISSFATYIPALSDYLEAIATFEANVTPIYVRYISNDAAFGLAIASWPEWFARYVTLELAWRAAKRIHQGSGDRDKLADDRDEALKVALLSNMKMGAVAR